MPATAVAVRGDTVSLMLGRPVLPEETVSLDYLSAPVHPVWDAAAPRTRGTAVSGRATHSIHADLARLRAAMPVLPWHEICYARSP